MSFDHIISGNCNSKICLTGDNTDLLDYGHQVIGIKSACSG